MKKLDKKISIVDDHNGVRQSLCAVLEHDGYVVNAFESGEKFLSDGLNSPPDCIVLDLDMPRINGGQVLEQLESKSVSVPVVVVTGTDDGALLASAQKKNVHCILHKPIGPDALLSEVARAISGKTNGRRHGPI